MSKQRPIEEEVEKERKKLEEEINIEIGRVVRAYRKYHNITSDDLAYSLGISYSQMMNIERGTTTTNYQTILQLNCLIGKDFEIALENAKSKMNHFLKKNHLYDV
ncbi:helix-turn-helix domain-containing protein [Halalkalibacter akibai]|uniref:HTH cro/C1-type domain-containing protein n=1 Tax=Halalkalibacter akibai (strain ATCC 43226 / DSM 21942 / CIP 109018 / JCM 9157 / 1139) TaxID=1236973 RepID=W4QUK3_HALA3|nr:helix-turn-helix transcriptional regulator [Halalkalibacter akibai]GAE34999.1 hypothetical protein JCM9157_2091 [Halalkalibacter akibai JCM 9157]